MLALLPAPSPRQSQLPPALVGADRQRARRLVLLPRRLQSAAGTDRQQGAGGGTRGRPASAAQHLRRAHRRRAQRPHQPQAHHDRRRRGALLHRARHVAGAHALDGVAGLSAAASRDHRRCVLRTRAQRRDPQHRARESRCCRQRAGLDHVVLLSGRRRVARRNGRRLLGRDAVFVLNACLLSALRLAHPPHEFRGAAHRGLPPLHGRELVEFTPDARGHALHPRRPAPLRHGVREGRHRPARRQQRAAADPRRARFPGEARRPGPQPRRHARHEHADGRARRRRADRAAG